MKFPLLFRIRRFILTGGASIFLLYFILSNGNLFLYTPSQSLEELISEKDFQFLVVPQNNPCLEQPTVLITVKSRLLEFEYRQTIRQTYGQIAAQLNMRVVFFVGNADDPFYAYLIKLEASIYDDIVQANFTDTYRNVTLKSYSVLRWTVLMCSNAKYYFSTDSDVIVFPEYLLEYLTNMETQSNYIIGYCKMYGAPVVRDVASKWYVSKYVYPNEMYPPHCLGCGYISTHDVPKKLMSALESDPKSWRSWVDFPIDDALYTGILVQQANVSLKGSPIVSWLGWDFDLCNPYQHVISAHRYEPPKYMHQKWDDYQNHMKNCSSVSTTSVKP